MSLETFLGEIIDYLRYLACIQVIVILYLLFNRLYDLIKTDKIKKDILYYINILTDKAKKEAHPSERTKINNRIMILEELLKLFK